MATYCPSLSNQRDVLPAPYLASYAELSPGTSLSLHDCVQVSSIGARDEVEFIPQTGEQLNVEPAPGRLNFTSSSVDNSVNEDSQMGSRTPIHLIDGEQNLRCQGLSLSLGTQMPSGVYVPSFHYQYTDADTSSLLRSYVQVEDGSRSKESRNDEYLSYDLPGGTHNNIEVGTLNNPYCFVCPGEMHSSPHLYEPSGLVRTILDSQYLNAAQQLLDEVVNVHKAVKQSEIDDKHSNSHEFGLCGSKDIDVKMNGNSSDPLDLITNCSSELSPSERQDLQNKLTKLLSMLDEVDRRYMQYYHQMQTVVSSFEMVAGDGAAELYTALALKTISRHFRSLRDAINSQIRVTQQKLGEQDSTPTGQGGLPRLRYLVQQLRQQRALQHVGVMRHSWRPQRGLPESSVSILRAWLFEHFLNPYPKDLEKIMLARQTGLTRSQVANWFINARVRLWKPMVEEMYTEEFGELDFKSSPENAPEAARDKSWVSKDTGEELQESVTTKGADGDLMGQFDDSKFDLVCDLGIQGCTARLGLQNGDGNSNSAAASYNISDLGSFSVSKQVSLALGLRYCEKDSVSTASGIQFRGDLTGASSVGHDTSDYHCVDSLNQHGITSPHPLPDFAA